jgi:alkanesulfonate monooxygenase SsuD/methylene tetrahydromethanopterin reductase-like flavin-dependent oxidoreductase (luciferase family)
MEIGIGLPSTIPHVDGSAVLDWAVAAEELGFSCLGVVDRLLYTNFDPLITLAAAAAVTTRVRLLTGVLVAPLRPNIAFAKQAATIDRFAPGRLVLGLGVGSRPDDYEIAGLDFHKRGQAFDVQLDAITSIWRGEQPRLGPPPATPGGPALLFGGTAPATFRRMTTYRGGWIASSGTARGFVAGRDRALEAWQQAGLPGRPRLVAHCYSGAGPNALTAANASLRDYYAHRANDLDQIVGAALLDETSIAVAVEELAEAGCDEFILTPVDASLEQVELLARAAGVSARS